MTVIVPVIGLVGLAFASRNGVTVERNVLTIAALFPGLFLLESALRTDRFPEPTGLVLLAFVLGALTGPLAGIAEVFVRSVADAPMRAIFGWFGSEFSSAFFEAALCEESVKYLVLVACFVPLKAFDEPIDGVVYGVAVALGFASIENLLSVHHGKTFVEGLQIALARTITAVPAHAADGAVMGFCVGLAMYVTRGRWFLLFAGWACPIAMHGAYDLLIFVNRHVDGVLSRPWWYVFLYEVMFALRMIRKLQAVQAGRSPDSLARAGWRKVVRKLSPGAPSDGPLARGPFAPADAHGSLPDATAGKNVAESAPSVSTATAATAATPASGGPAAHKPHGDG
jgi:RsiW-degrading membrane proteinase PrsW (M82 family)